VTTVLAFDTAGAHCAVALLVDGRVTARVEVMAVGQAERLMPLLAEVLAIAGLGWPDISVIGVGTGPGNFTGIRIGVSAARGLALGLGIPAIGVTGFDSAGYGLTRPVTVDLPAPRGQVWRQTLLTDGAGEASLTDGDAPDQDPAATVTAIAHIAALRANTPQPRPAPFYVRGPDAAPPRDPPPVIFA
jgi:tRNA threonylcarbamoyladenosine biosynthesis protein TsaB